MDDGKSEPQTMTLQFCGRKIEVVAYPPQDDEFEQIRIMLRVDGKARFNQFFTPKP